MARVNRILDQNLMVGSGTVLTASSAVASLPVRFLRDQLRSKVWRSGTGWTIIAGVNDKLDFDPASGSAVVATIAAGFYASSSDLGAAIKAAMEAADGFALYAVTYNSGTGAFTISTTPGFPFVLLFGTGANVATDIAQEIGFPATDTADLDAHTSAAGFFMGNHYLYVDLLSAQGITVAALLDTNLSASATVTLGFSATSVALAATAPAVTKTLTQYSAADIWLAYFASESYRYLAFKIVDPGNVDGFVEVGIAYAGTYRQPSVVNSTNEVEEGDDLSDITMATEGAPHGDMRPEVRAWQLDWQDITDADAAIFRAHRTATPKGKCFFFAFDAVDDPGNILYGYRETPLPMPRVNTSYWNPSFSFREAAP